MPGHENVEVAPVELQELAEIDGDHIGGAQSAAEQRHFAEKGASLQQDGLPGRRTSAAPAAMKYMRRRARQGE